MKISIVIPTCNEKEYLQKTLNAAQNHASGKHGLEIIVIDCGSTDGTINSIKQKSIVVVTNPMLSGKKWASLRLGARLAQGDVFLFLDADTLLPPDYDLAIAKALHDEKVVGGAFEFAFIEQTPALRFITLVNRIRYRFRKHFWGDQALFVRKNVYLASGGWPERYLMETAYFCKELKKKGRLALLNPPIRTSARRFLDGGVLKVFMHDLRIWFKDLMGYDVEKYAKAYWQHNGHHPKPLSRPASVKQVPLLKEQNVPLRD